MSIDNTVLINEHFEKLEKSCTELQKSYSKVCATYLDLSAQYIHISNKTNFMDQPVKECNAKAISKAYEDTTYLHGLNQN